MIFFRLLRQSDQVIWKKLDNTEPVNSAYRADLSNHNIVLLLLGLLLAVLLMMAVWPEMPPPGSPAGQAAAIIGSLLLLGPALFSIVKRGESTRNPPLWFVIHVFTACGGCFFIFIHVASANLISPPGLVLALLVILIIQGGLMRTIITRGYSQLFARNTQDGGFSAGSRPDREKIRLLITQKTELLQRLEPSAEEALFSPVLSHWLRHPLLSLQYQQLAATEAALVGGRASAPFMLRWARRWHMIIASLFFAGLLVHVITVLFFAGYVAGDGEITWWFVSDWGAPE